MAQHKSAEKRNRQTIRRTEVNRVRVGQIRTTVKAVELAILTGDKAKAQAALVKAQPIIMSGVSKGVLKITSASRKMSRLSARVKAIGSTV
jgi:small subunit ribosomal protein S20